MRCSQGEVIVYASHHTSGEDSILTTPITRTWSKALFARNKRAHNGAQTPPGDKRACPVNTIRNIKSQNTKSQPVYSSSCPGLTVTKPHQCIHILSAVEQQTVRPGKWPRVRDPEFTRQTRVSPQRGGGAFVGFNCLWPPRCNQRQTSLFQRDVRLRPHRAISVASQYPTHDPTCASTQDRHARRTTTRLRTRMRD